MRLNTGYFKTIISIKPAVHVTSFGHRKEDTEKSVLPTLRSRYDYQSFFEIFEAVFLITVTGKAIIYFECSVFKLI